jgi:hypothetical protein
MWVMYLSFIFYSLRKFLGVISEISNGSLGVKLRQAADGNMFFRHGYICFRKLVTEHFGAAFVLPNFVKLITIR